MVFPVYAGVIPSLKQEVSDYASFPRIRGGDPNAPYDLPVLLLFSPYTRG